MDVKLGFLANTELFLPEIFCHSYSPVSYTLTKEPRLVVQFVTIYKLSFVQLRNDSKQRLTVAHECDTRTLGCINFRRTAISFFHVQAEVDRKSGLVGRANGAGGARGKQTMTNLLE